MRSKILHISKYYYPFRGGIEQTAKDCVSALANQFEQKVICFNHQKGNCVDRIDDIEIIRCACQLKVASQSLSAEFGKKLKKVLQEFQPDYIIFHYPNPYVAHILLHEFPVKTKLILYWHLDITKQKLLGKLFYKQNLNLLEQANIVIATSPNYIKGSRYLSKYRGKCAVIPSCINEERLAIMEEEKIVAEKIRNQNRGKIICLSVGRHVSYKGFKYLIKASKLLDDRFVFYLVGEGELTNSLKQQAKQDHKVHFLGSLDDKELKALLLATDIFCFPSITKNEAFGLALAEGMYFGKPAVTFTINGSGVNYVNLNNVTGIEVKNCDYIEYAHALKKLADDNNLRYAYGLAASIRVKNNFLYSQYIENIRKIFL